MAFKGNLNNTTVCVLLLIPFVIIRGRIKNVNKQKISAQQLYT